MAYYLAVAFVVGGFLRPDAAKIFSVCLSKHRNDLHLLSVEAAQTLVLLGKRNSLRPTFIWGMARRAFHCAALATGAIAPH